MALHSTNYADTFIRVAEDCPVEMSEAPVRAGSVAVLQYEMLVHSAYRHTSDDVLFAVFALRKGISDSQRIAVREMFFSRGQPCFRASALVRRYGFGVHFDGASRMAIHGMETQRYRELAADTDLRQLAGFRSRRAR